MQSINQPALETFPKDHIREMNLHEAAYNGVDDRIKILLKNGALINELREDGKTALMLAVEASKESTIKLLLENRANPNIRDENDSSCLAKAFNHESIYKLLLECNANPNQPSKNILPIHAAVEDSNLTYISWLHQKGVDINAPNMYGQPPINVALFSEDYSTAMHLQSLGVKFDLEKLKEKTFQRIFPLTNPLALKIFKLLTINDLYNLRCVSFHARQIATKALEEFSVKYGNRVNYINWREVSGIEYFSRIFSVIKKLKKHISLIPNSNTIDIEGTIHNYSEITSPEIVDLFETKTFFNHQHSKTFHLFLTTIYHKKCLPSDEMGKAISKALKNPYDPAITFLSNIQANPNYTDENDLSPLNASIYKQNFSLSKIILDLPTIDVNYKSWGSSPLHFSTANEWLEGIRILLKRGALIDDQNQNQGHTPLMLILNIDIRPTLLILMAELLLEKGANPNIADFDGQTCLESVFHSPELFKLLLDHNADPNQPFSDGLLPLHQAVILEKLNLIEWLCQKGANINQQNTEGQTPLNIALAEKHFVVAKTLLKMGADPKAANQDGKTPLDFVENHEEMKQLLLEYGENNQL